MSSGRRARTSPDRAMQAPGVTRSEELPLGSSRLPTPCHRRGPCRDQLHTHPTCHGHPIRTDSGTEVSDADPPSIRPVLLVGTCSECQASLAANVPSRRNPRWAVSGGELCPRCWRRLGDGGGGQGQHYDRTSPSPPAGGGRGLATATPALAALGSALGGACASPHPLCPSSSVLAGLAGKRGHSHHPGPTLDGVPEMHAAGQPP